MIQHTSDHCKRAGKHAIDANEKRENHEINDGLSAQSCSEIESKEIK